MRNRFTFLRLVNSFLWLGGAWCLAARCFFVVSLQRNLYSRTAEGFRKFYTFFSVAWIPLNRHFTSKKLAMDLIGIRANTRGWPKLCKCRYGGTTVVSNWNTKRVHWIHYRGIQLCAEMSIVVDIKHADRFQDVCRRSTLIEANPTRGPNSIHIFLFFLFLLSIELKVERVCIACMHLTRAIRYVKSSCAFDGPLLP